MGEEQKPSGNGIEHVELDEGDGDEDEGELRMVVQELSNRAFELATEVASTGNGEEMKLQAREMTGFLNELVPLIREAPSAHQ